MPGSYARINEDTIRYQPFAIYRIDDEDAQNFYIKNYLPVAVSAAAAPPRRTMGGAVALKQTRRLAFAEIGSGLPQSGQWRQGFAIADMNGDGKPDLVLPPARKTLGPPVILLNEGAGNWRRWREATFPPLPYDYGAVVVADFNGDGRPDIALASHLVGVGVLLSDGNGKFRAFNDGLPPMKAGERTAQSFSSKTIQAVDWDGDGRIDLVLQQEAGGGRALTATPDSLVVFLNRGDRWQLLDAGSGSRVAGDKVAIADFDGDGRPDAVLASVQQGVKRLVRLNRGAALAAADLDELPDGAYVETVAVADVNGDGKPDIVVALQAWDGAQWIAGLDVMVNAGGRFIQRPLWREASADHVTALDIADIDGDGHPDIVALRKDGSLLSFISDGRGFFSQDATFRAPAWRAGCTGVDVRVVDLDGPPHAAKAQRAIVAAFAGEPNPLEIPPRCRNEGGLATISVSVAPRGAED